MPHVYTPRQTSARSYQSKKEILKKMDEALPRDDLQQAFAGNENKGPSGIKLKSRSTNVKSRKTRQSRTKTPIR